MSKDDRELIEALKVGTTFGLPYDPPRPNACVPNFPEADRLMRLAATRLETLQGQPVGEDIAWLERNSITDSGAAWFDQHFGLFNNEEGDPIGPLIITSAVAQALRARALTASPPVVEREALRSAISNVPLDEPEQIGDTGRYGAAALTIKQTDDILAAVLKALGPLMLRLSDAEAEPLPAGEPLTDDDGVCIAIGELRALHAILALTPVEGVGR